jgi:Helicase conserved C-terminal domain
MLDRLGQFPAQKVLATGTLPPRMEALLLSKSYLNHDPPTHITIRAPTLRPELAHHVVLIPPKMPKTVLGLDITVDLAKSLCGLLRNRERMIIFVMSVSDADALSERLGCSKYYSALGENAELGKDEKAINHGRWVNGQSAIMVATPALIQGIDYPNVRFIIFHGGAYGLMNYYQGAGRGGRSGSRCDVYTVRDVRCRFNSREDEEDVQASAEWKEFVATSECRLRVIMDCFDGHPLNCSSIPNQQPCDNCCPRDKFHGIALAVITTGLAVGSQTSTSSTKKRLAGLSSSDEFSNKPLSPWNSPLKLQDFVNAKQTMNGYKSKRPRLDQAISPSGSSPFHSSVFRPSPSSISKRTVGTSYSLEPPAEQEYKRKNQEHVSSSLCSWPFQSSTFRPSPSYSHEPPAEQEYKKKNQKHSSSSFRSAPFQSSAFHSSPLRPPPSPIPHSTSLSATTWIPSTSGTSWSQRGGVGKAILRGASENGRSENEKREKSARLSNLMPILQGICPICFILTGTKVKSLPIGDQEGLGHQPFRDCGLPVDFDDFTKFRNKIVLRTPYFYCFTCAMPQNKDGNRLEPKIHSDWSDNVRRSKVKHADSETSGSCPWSNIIQACVYAMFFHPTTMEALVPCFNYTDKDNWEEMTLDEWCKWLCNDLFEEGEYWKGLEVFLFMMAQHGLIGA